MTLKDLFEVREMTYPLQMDKKNIGIGKRTKVSNQKVTIRDTKTGKSYGSKTLIQK